MKQKSSRFCSHNPWRSTIVAFIVIARGSLESANLNDERNQPCSSHTEQQREILLCECINYYPRPFVTCSLVIYQQLQATRGQLCSKKRTLYRTLVPINFFSFFFFFFLSLKQDTPVLSETCVVSDSFILLAISGLKKSIHFG